ncbi:hypothetical protein [Marinospirillum sp.]|uniref:hypothetical protein n=1 Tax=Marinospirillum sp. TaxID=2183934 RepID=UPI00384E1602
MKFVYRWNETQFLYSALYDYQLGSQKDRRHLFFGLVLFAVTGILVIKWLDQGFQVIDLVFVLLGALWFGMRRRLLVWMFKRAFKRSGQEGLDLTFEVNEDGVNAQVDSRPPQHYDWTDIRRVLRTEKGFLLYPGLLWLPASGLQEDANLEEVAALFQRKVTNYKDKSRYRLKTAF